MAINKIISKVRSVLFEPTKFFTKLRERGIGDSFLYLAALYLVNLAGSLIVSLIMPISFFAMIGILPQTEPSTSWIFFGMIIGYFATLALSFLFAGILHLWIRIFGGRVPYEKTYQMMIYAGTPSILLGWIPLLGFVAWAWSLILMITATPKTHDISIRKSIALYLIPIVTFVALIIILLGAFIAVILSMGEIGQFT